MACEQKKNEPTNSHLVFWRGDFYVVMKNCKMQLRSICYGRPVTVSETVELRIGLLILTDESTAHLITHQWFGYRTHNIDQRWYTVRKF